LNRDSHLGCSPVSLALALRAADSAATPAGRWRTVDDKTGKIKAIIVLYEEKGCCLAVWKRWSIRRRQICNKCGDERKGQAVAAWWWFAG